VIEYLGGLKMVPSAYAIEIRSMMEFKIAQTITELHCNRERYGEKIASE
jgi:hypothetical protein